MRTLLLNLTTSLDGFIADRDGGIDWIQPFPDDAEVPSGYLELIASVDVLVMGRATYESSLILEGGTDVFAGRRIVVFTSRTDLKPREGIEFVHSDAVAFVERLKAEPGGVIWLYGGGQLATTLAAAGLIDDYLMVVQPILLGDGIRLWRSGLPEIRLKLTGTRDWPGGLVEVRYRPACEEVLPHLPSR